MFDKKLESLNVRHKINYGFNFVIKLMVASGILSIMALSWVFKDVKKNIGASGSLSSTTAVFIIGIILIMISFCLKKKRSIFLIISIFSFVSVLR